MKLEFLQLEPQMYEFREILNTLILSPLSNFFSR